MLICSGKTQQAFLIHRFFSSQLKKVRRLVVDAHKQIITPFDPHFLDGTHVSADKKSALTVFQAIVSALPGIDQNLAKTGVLPPELRHVAAVVASHDEVVFAVAVEVAAPDGAHTRQLHGRRQRDHIEFAVALIDSHGR